MDHTKPNKDSLDQPSGEDRFSRLERLVAGMEQDIDLKKQRRDRPAPKLEPFYMSFFIAFMVAALGGMEGYMRKGVEAVDVLGRMPEDNIFKRVTYDINGVIFGFGHHIRDYWMLDASIVGLALLAFFGLKEVKPRRRAFSMLAAVVVLAYTALMVTSMFDLSGGLRLKV